MHLIVYPLPTHTPVFSHHNSLAYYFKLQNNEVIPDDIFNSFASLYIHIIHNYIYKINLLHFSQIVHTLLISIIPLNKYSYIYLLVVHRYWIIFIDVWQKPTQYCKAIILQLKINTRILLLLKTL